jgi:hypothetical protein
MAPEDMLAAAQAVTPATDGTAPTWQTIKAYFQREHTGRFLLDEEKHTIQWIVTQDNGTHRLIVRWQEELRRLHVLIPHLLTVPQEKRPPMAVLKDLINGDLFIGGFQLDHVDGELYFQNNLALADSTLTDDQLETYVYASISTVNTFQPGFYLLVWCEMSPEEAFASVEY